MSEWEFAYAGGGKNKTSALGAEVSNSIKRFLLIGSLNHACSVDFFRGSLCIPFVLYCSSSQYHGVQRVRYVKFANSASAYFSFGSFYSTVKAAETSRATDDGIYRCSITFQG